VLFFINFAKKLIGFGQRATFSLINTTTNINSSVKKCLINVLRRKLRYFCATRTIYKTNLGRPVKNGLRKCVKLTSHVRINIYSFFVYPVSFSKTYEMCARKSALLFERNFSRSKRLWLVLTHKFEKWRA